MTTTLMMMARAMIEQALVVLGHNTYNICSAMLQHAVCCCHTVLYCKITQQPSIHCPTRHLSDSTASYVIMQHSVKPVKQQRERERQRGSPYTIALAKESQESERGKTLSRTAASATQWCFSCGMLLCCYDMRGTNFRTHKHAQCSTLNTVIWFCLLY